MKRHLLQPVYIIGPTASGKSELAVCLARELDGVIISADSMQIYRGLDIGTAKESEAVRREIEHKLIDVRDVDEQFSVAEYAQLAQEEIKSALDRGKLPVIVGGTGLYIEALIYPMRFASTCKNEDIRAYLQYVCENSGARALHGWLEFFDPEAANRLHENDVKRVIRALEIYLTTGKPMSAHKDASDEPNVIMVGLNAERQELYRRINERVDKMFQQGLVQEALSVGNFGYQSMQAIGYKEFADCKFSVKNGEFCLEDGEEERIKELIKQHTRNYAKRQLTWFRKYGFVRWFDCGELRKALEWIKRQLAK